MNGVRKNEREARKRLARAREFANVAGAMMELKPGLLDLITEDTIICRCENVPAGRITGAIGAENDFTLRGVKIHTRAGMGPCQGRMCGCLVARLIASKAGAPLNSVHPDTPRIPIKPIPVRALAVDAER
jgi:NAD(P)H-nitrite reductase large subunit